jgi:hypothetical protein
MSRPSVILCTSKLKWLIYKLWRRYSYWTNKYTTAKKLIHIKLLNDSNLVEYVSNLSHQTELIK